MDPRIVDGFMYDNRPSPASNSGRISSPASPQVSYIVSQKPLFDDGEEEVDFLSHSVTPISNIKESNILESSTVPLAMEFADVCDIESPRQQSSEQHQQSGQPYYTADGCCYFDSPDGWRYMWCENAQSWTQHTYLRNSVPTIGHQPGLMNRKVVSPSLGSWQQDPHPCISEQPGNNDLIRPPLTVVKIGFGGKFITVSPQGQLELHTATAGLPQHLLNPVTSTTTSLAEETTILSAFPGPLGPSIDKDKLSKFISSRLDLHADVDAERLWRLLHLMSQHPGTSKHIPQPQLLETVFTLQSAPSNLNKRLSDGTGNGTSQIDAIEALLLGGRKEEALQRAIDTGLWAVALLISKLVGGEAVSSTTKDMVDKCLNNNAALATLCLQLGGCHSPEAVPVASNWADQVGMLAMNRCPGDEVMLCALGKRYLSKGNVCASHVAFVLGDCPLLLYDLSKPGLALLSVDPWSQPRTYASPSAIAMSQIYSWCRTVSNASLVSQHMSILPYKLIYAHMLAEYGMLGASAAYCSSIASSLPGQNLSGGLALCRALSAALHDRLQIHAAAHKMSLHHGGFKPGTIVSSVGKWLDKNITALLGESEGTSSPSGIVHHKRNASTASHTSDGGGGLAGLLGRVTSFGKIIGSSTPPPEPSEPENIFYYDQDLKLWRERGMEPPSAAQPLAPPPLAGAPSVSQTHSPSTGVFSRYASAGLEARPCERRGGACSFLPSSASKGPQEQVTQQQVWRPHL